MNPTTSAEVGQFEENVNGSRIWKEVDMSPPVGGLFKLELSENIQEGMVVRLLTDRVDQGTSQAHVGPGRLQVRCLCERHGESREIGAEREGFERLLPLQVLRIVPDQQTALSAESR